MIYLPGNTGFMYTHTIKYTTYKLDGNFITFICGPLFKTVKFEGTALEYINSPHYSESTPGTLVFKKPDLFAVEPWGYEGLEGTNLVRDYLFEGEYKKFERCFGKSYYSTGNIINAENAIDYWNTHNFENLRLAKVICNYIIEHEWDRINEFKNKDIDLTSTKSLTETFTEQRSIRLLSKKYGKTFTTCECKCSRSAKEIFGDFYPFFKKHVHTGFEIVNMETIHANCDFDNIINIRIFKNSNIVGRIHHITSCDLPLVEINSKITLKRPPKYKIPGIPWCFSKPDFKINGTECHKAVLRARGGDYFKYIQDKKELSFDFDAKCLIDFIYRRQTEIKNAKVELQIARYILNSEYEKYIFNYLIDNDIYLYYKFQK